MRYQTYVWTHLSRSGVPSKGGVLIGCYSFPNVWLVWMLFCFKWLTTYWYGSWTAVSGEAHKAQSKQFSIVGGVLDQMLFFFKHVCSVWSIIMCVCPPCFCATHNFCNQSSSGTTMLVFIGLSLSSKLSSPILCCFNTMNCYRFGLQFLWMGTCTDGYGACGVGMFVAHFAVFGQCECVFTKTSIGLHCLLFQPMAC